MMNRIIGHPIMSPSSEGDFPIYNPEALSFMVGNVDHKAYRLKEGAIYRFSSSGTLLLVSQFSLEGKSDHVKAGQWPLNNWVKMLLNSTQLTDGAFQAKKSFNVKADNFRAISESYLEGHVSASTHEMRPSLGYLYPEEDTVEGDVKNITLSAKRLKAIMYSRLCGLVGNIKKNGCTESQDAQLTDLTFKFRNMMEITSGGVDDQTLCVSTIQFGERFEEFGVEAQDLLVALPLINKVDNNQELKFKIKQGAIGEDANCTGWITPVIQSTPMWHFNHRSDFLNKDRTRFVKEISQQDLEERLIPAATT